MRVQGLGGRGMERMAEKWDGILRDSSCRGKSSAHREKHFPQVSPQILLASVRQELGPMEALIRRGDREM